MKAKVVLTIILVVVISTVLTSQAMAAPAKQIPTPVSDVLAILFPPEFVKAAAGLLLVIVLDLVLGISVAIKAKVFEWSKLADFYRSTVIPNVLGWAVADVLLRIGAYYQLPVIEQLQPLGTVALYALVLAALLGQIGTKLSALRGETAAS